MRRCLVVLFVVSALCQPMRGQAQDAGAGKTIHPGLHLAPVPEVIYAQMPQLPHGQGLVVEQVAPAARIDLQRHDILLSYDGQPLRDLEQFNRAVLATKVDHKAPLVVLRAGKEVKLDVALHSTEILANNVKGVIKPGGPPAVAVECTFLDTGKLQIVLGYYTEMSSKLETVTCTGTLTEIEQQVRERRLPARVQELVDVAIKRLRKN
jgi:hypothetical protein